MSYSQSTQAYMNAQMAVPDQYTYLNPEQVRKVSTDKQAVRSYKKPLYFMIFVIVASFFAWVASILLLTTEKNEFEKVVGGVTLATFLGVFGYAVYRLYEHSEKGLAGYANERIAAAQVRQQTYQPLTQTAIPPVSYTQPSVPYPSVPYTPPYNPGYPQQRAPPAAYTYASQLPM
jgi:hypothetical protein